MSGWPYSTQRWKRLRLAHLSLYPWCEGCEAMGIRTLANTVDHRIPIRGQGEGGGGDPFPSHDQLSSFCSSCHNAKTARGIEAGAVHSAKPRRGCDADGNPLDPTHPWRKSLAADSGRPPFDRKTQLVYKRSRSEGGNG